MVNYHWRASRNFFCSSEARLRGKASEFVFRSMAELAREETFVNLSICLPYLSRPFCIASGSSSSGSYSAK